MKEFSPRVARRLVALLVVPLAGCATYRAQPIHPERSADALVARSLADPRLRRFLAIEEHRVVENGSGSKYADICEKQPTT